MPLAHLPTGEPTWWTVWSRHGQVAWLRARSGWDQHSKRPAVHTSTGRPAPVVRARDHPVHQPAALVQGSDDAPWPDIRALAAARHGGGQKFAVACADQDEGVSDA